jgi:predicted dehydrogenase
LNRFADAYLAQVRDFAQTILAGKAPRVTGEDGLKALEIAVAADNSYKIGAPCKVAHAAAAK